MTIIKKWDDGLTNAEREIPDMYLSTEKPSKSTKGSTVTFHGNGLKFADGTDENMVVYNSSGQIVEGSYREAVGTGVGWYSDKTCKNKVEISDDGVPQIELTGDLDLWAKEMTFEIKGYIGQKGHNIFNYLTPNTVTEIVFTDEVKPKDKASIDVDADGDSGVVAWLNDDAGTVMKVSTQIPGVKIQAAKDSRDMFSGESQLHKIDLKMLDTQNVTDMYLMFRGCSGLTNLDLTPLDTQNVTNMGNMFAGCSGLTSLDLMPLDTQNVTDMSYMFCGCSGLTSLDLSPLDTQNVTYMECMFAGCIKLTKIDCSRMIAKEVTFASDMFCYCQNLSELKLPKFSEKLKIINEKIRGLRLLLDNGNYVADVYGMFEGCERLANIGLSPLNTSNITDMNYMFYRCRSLTSLDLTPLNTQNVTNMDHMFSGCSGLTSLDLTPLDTQKVTSMHEMFEGCSGLTNLDLTPLDTQNVTDMGRMFSGCSGLTSLDLTPLDTSKVTNMNNMFSGCSGLTSLDLAPLDTQNVTDMRHMFYDCSGLTSFTTGTTFKFVGIEYALYGTWQNTAGETFNGNYNTANFPSNVADTYTKISS